MPFHNPPAYRQPETRPRILVSMKPLEDGEYTFSVLGIESNAFVSDGKKGIPPSDVPQRHGYVEAFHRET